MTNHASKFRDIRSLPPWALAVARRGWSDRLGGLPFPLEYEAAPKTVQWAYEYGRLLACNAALAGDAPAWTDATDLRQIYPAIVRAEHLRGAVIPADSAR